MLFLPAAHPRIWRISNCPKMSNYCSSEKLLHRPMSSSRWNVGTWPEGKLLTTGTLFQLSSGEALCVKVSVCIVHVHSMFLCRHVHVYERKSLREKKEQEQRIWQQPHTVQMKDTHSALNSNGSSLRMVTVLAERTKQSWESSIAFSGAVSLLALS